MALASLHVQQRRKPQHSTLYTLRWRLLALFFPLAGPFLAPLFMRFGIQPFTTIARIVYWLGDIFCPLPGRAVTLGPYSTAVCPLCYGALLGLATILLSFPLRPVLRRCWERLSWQLQLLLITCWLLPWLIDYVIQKAGLTFTPDWAMYLIGIPGGCAVGLLGYVVLGRSGDLPRRQYLAKFAHSRHNSN